MSYNSKYKGAEVETLLDKINIFDPSAKVDKTGDTMSGGLTATFFQTGDDESNYFQCRKFRGEGDATVYYHAIDFGYSGNNKTDFYEYSGIWNFYQNQTEDGSGKILVGSITPNGWVGNVVGDVTGKVLLDGEGNEIHSTYAKKISVIDHGTNDATFELTPNKLHRWGEMGSLTLTLAAPTDATIVNHYMVEFVSGATATTLTMPDSIVWHPSLTSCDR